jgi:hypothetical protein
MLVDYVIVLRLAWRTLFSSTVLDIFQGSLICRGCVFEKGSVTWISRGLTRESNVQ